MQRYTEIPSSETLANSLSLILNNDKTGISNNAGTAFPTVNLQAGMTCYRTDQKKLYQLVDVASSEWRVVADLSGDARLLDGGDGNTIDYDKQNLNDWNSMPTGFYQGSNMLNAPSGDTSWRVIQIRQGNSDGYSTQLAFGVSTGKMFTRFQRGGIWSDWNEVALSTGGNVSAGLNADKVDGKEPGNAAGNIPINNGTVNTSLNADMVDGYHAGNAANNIPVNNGQYNEQLNAGMVNGKRVGNASGNIPLSNGTLNVNLNAEMVGGVKVEQLVRKDGGGTISGVNTLNVTNANIQNANVQYFTPHSYSGSTQNHQMFQVTGIKDTSIDRYTDAGGSGDSTGYRYYIETIQGHGGGSYNLYQIVQNLLNNSHKHQAVRETYRYSSDCNCACDCNCDCDSDMG